MRKFLELRKLEDLLPDFWKNIKEIEEIQLIGDSVIDDINNALAKVECDAFIDSASVDSIERYEKEFKISKGGNESLATRRKRIALLFAQPKELSKKNFEEQLKALMGSKGGEISRDDINYELKIVSHLENFDDVRSLARWLDRATPVNTHISLTNSIERSEKLGVTGYGIVEMTSEIILCNGGNKNINCSCGINVHGEIMMITEIKLG